MATISTSLVGDRLKVRIDLTEEEAEEYGIKAFCPTGLGGGVDPTCSGKGSSRPGEKEARENYKKLSEKYGEINKDYIAASKKSDKDKTPEERASAAVDLARTTRLKSEVLFDMTTERMSVEASDPLAYRSARESYREKVRKWHEEEEAFIEKLVKDGVTNREYFNRIDSGQIGNWYGDPKDPKVLEYRSKDYLGLKSEHIEVAIDLNRRRPDRFVGDKSVWQEFEESQKNAYYGESTVVRDLPRTGGSDAYSLPPKALRGGADETTKAFMGQAELGIQMKLNSLEALASTRDGSFKNGFQKNVGSVGKGKSGYFQTRKDREEEIHGIPTSASADQRPVSGYLEHPDRILRTGAEIGGNYGGVQVVLKPEVKQRTTFTVGDSLDDTGRNGLFAGSVSDPPSLNGHPTGKRFARDNQPVPSYNVSRNTSRGWMTGGRPSNSPRDDYDEPHEVSLIEAQIFGKTTLKDVKEIRIPRGWALSDKAEKRFQKEGVKVVRVAPPHLEVYASSYSWDSMTEEPEEHRSHK